MLLRSINSSAARAPARLAGHRRCIQSPETLRGCWKNSERDGRRRSRLRYPAIHDSVDQSVLQRLGRIEIEIGPLGVADDFLEWLTRPYRKNLVDLRLHLLEAIEMLRCGRRRLPSGPFRRLVNHDPRMRIRQPPSVAGGLQDDRSH